MMVSDVDKGCTIMWGLRLYSKHDLSQFLHPVCNPIQLDASAQLQALQTCSCCRRYNTAWFVLSNPPCCGKQQPSFR